MKSTHRTAIPPARRRHLGTCGKKYNTVLIARETPAARRWLPQALRYRLFRDVLC